MVGLVPRDVVGSLWDNKQLLPAEGGGVGLYVRRKGVATRYECAMDDCQPRIGYIREAIGSPANGAGSITSSVLRITDCP